MPGSGPMIYIRQPTDLQSKVLWISCLLTQTKLSGGPNAILIANDVDNGRISIIFFASAGTRTPSVSTGTRTCLDRARQRKVEKYTDIRQQYEALKYIVHLDGLAFGDVRSTDDHNYMNLSHLGCKPFYARRMHQWIINDILHYGHHLWIQCCNWTYTGNRRHTSQAGSCPSHLRLTGANTTPLAHPTRNSRSFPDLQLYFTKTSLAISLSLLLIASPAS
ncbi:hypothetical protein DFQ28_000772 [Apophysomyces sp. BC1034]|nr:hypothetical protein DFQ30_006661 [Apophysomyces sp. BC1015]KAG0183242.1 hypothetical protein DFQ29_008602 [Apophysomyces sp. BC1021]KAG0191169.1 hypothetical protein DFQ28_000772 [Apophysomyces sp. BC1034]